MMIRRLLLLYAGLFFFGLSMAMMLRSDLGLSPWDVFHQGVADRTPEPYFAVVAGSATRQMPRPCVAA